MAEELGVQLEGVDGHPVLHRVDPQRGLDLTVWVSRRSRGDVSNMQPHEHDAIGWFGSPQVEGLKLADPLILSGGAPAPAKRVSRELSQANVA